MAEEPKSAANTTKSSSPSDAARHATPKSNPAFRALGLPNLRFRLPSRNWIIFLTITGSWTGALLYDRQQKKKIQRKWCDLVEHIARDSLPVNSLARRFTIYLAAPPGDGVRSAREHFVEYVKPILVAAALDWDVVEGRKEGDVRAGLSERIRRARRANGESPEIPLEADGKLALDALRQRTGVDDWPGVNGDLVIGRHTWKEYIRGLHEGWLGPLDAPEEVESSPVTPLLKDESKDPTTLDTVQTHALPEPVFQPDQSKSITVDAAPVDLSLSSGEEHKAEKTPNARKGLTFRLPYNTTDSYDLSPLPATVPDELPPSSPVPFPHILGFFNTPIRMYRFLNKRKLADDIGRRTAAAVLASHHAFASPLDRDVLDNSDYATWEQEGILKHEEQDWQKKALASGDGNTDRVWENPITLDHRIAGRMRLFELTPIDEERARRIGKGSSGIPGLV
ncbi:hypothetical protein FH972_021898 [Carpinus fangiana]|uniref:Mitochondrial import inner membrane translocase subunit TIM54 n=1 Tax=Carpinus fangiana TaxID=176857 RepID=A0A5N6KR15_9ROSI|nr:hypothetical protein FH972_021898 [Carpinus fangiana]